MDSDVSGSYWHAWSNLPLLVTDTAMGSYSDSSSRCRGCGMDSDVSGFCWHAWSNLPLPAMDTVLGLLQ